MDTTAPGIRLARRHDAAELSLMSRNLIERGLPWTWTPPRIQACIRDPDTNVIVVDHEGSVGGFAVMSFADDRAHLNLLAVRPSCQRRGMGRRLIRWLEAAARVAGTWVIELEVRVDNAGARDFYRRLGYSTSATIPRYYGGALSAIRMRSDLSQPVISTGGAAD